MFTQYGPTHSRTFAQIFSISMTRLSVNINKVALIRNSRGSNLPNLRQFAQDCEGYGADGITVHPRPDQRHIRYDDLHVLKEVVTTEFNIEGYPSEEFLKIVCEVRPHQCTLVPDPPGVLTSSEGWDTIKQADLLRDVISQLHDAGIRVSIFLDAELNKLEAVPHCGADRIELYTGAYAKTYTHDPEVAIKAHQRVSSRAVELGLGLNAGHDLNLDNLHYYKNNVSKLLEVSIGHALISDSLYFGIQNTIGMYKKLLR